MYRFNVVAAARAIRMVAKAEPDAPIALTLARITPFGINGQSDVTMRAEDAAALLATVREDQLVHSTSGQSQGDLCVLRIPFFH